MRQIIAMGGGGFSMEPDNPLLDQYILKQANKARPKICFIPTASGDADSYIEKFYNFFKQQDCEPSHLSLFKPHTRNLEEFVLQQDIIYVGGGNTKNLLVLWKEWGLDQMLKTAWEQGIILAGLSAGSICWYEQGITDSYGDKLEPLEALGFLPGSHCPHYDGEAERRPTYRQFVEQGTLQSGIAADDGAAVHYMDQEIKKIVSSRPAAKAYRVFKGGEEELVVEYLGD
ncbi:Peptidase E [Planococcus halocryophilus Or1]|uniref:Peptidase E n=1 Tax=Planococcus halocryophilus TaxID=1215089 RepID=A0A1C7DTI9_9BACL|nr:peptidase E [Planococcus halocryophilus]ANU14503.1 peptidase E [Planococcus halocryophilus]EMF48143.1 Peptidase E [Planococcus halocryophilus Or1]